MGLFKWWLRSLKPWIRRLRLCFRRSWFRKVNWAWSFLGWGLLHFLQILGCLLDKWCQIMVSLLILIIEQVWILHSLHHFLNLFQLFIILFVIAHVVLLRWILIVFAFNHWELIESHMWLFVLKWRWELSENLLYLYLRSFLNFHLIVLHLGLLCDVRDRVWWSLCWLFSKIWIPLDWDSCWVLFKNIDTIHFVQDGWGQLFDLLLHVGDVLGFGLII